MNFDKYNICVHIGYNKTASTFLQDIVFSTVNDINYLGKTEEYYPQWMIDWRYADDILFENKKESIVKNIIDSLDINKVNLISNESFASTGGEVLKISQRIKSIIPNAKIFMLLRDPIDHIWSFYKNSVENDNLYLSIDEFIDFKRTPMIYYKRKPSYIADYYYDETINVYKEAFLEKNVKVLKYEGFKNNAKVFYKELASFLSIDENKLIDFINSKDVLNRSSNSKDIDSLRIDNFTNYLIEKENYPTDMVKEVVRLLKIQNPQGKQEEIFNKMKKEIITRIKGKCNGYY